MRNDEYAILVNELQADPLGVGYANMTDQQVAASLNEPRFSVPTTRFITWRAIAAVLDDLVFHNDRGWMPPILIGGGKPLVPLSNM